MKVFGVCAVILVFVFFVMSCGTTPEPEIITRTQRVEVERLVEVVEERLMMPLTLSLLHQLQLSRPVEDLQLFLFGRLTLERRFVSSVTNVEDGRGLFINEHVTERITINDRTPGVARPQFAGERRLEMKFGESDYDILVFSSENRPDGFFELQYDNSDLLLLVGNARGSLEFRGERFNVNYIGDRAPHLLIELTQEDKDRINERTLEGRRLIHR